jgi:hypothetical protein
VCTSASAHTVSRPGRQSAARAKSKLRSCEQSQEGCGIGTDKVTSKNNFSYCQQVASMKVAMFVPVSPSSVMPHWSRPRGSPMRLCCAAGLHVELEPPVKQAPPRTHDAASGSERSVPQILSHTTQAFFKGTYSLPAVCIVSVKGRSWHHKGAGETDALVSAEVSCRALQQVLGNTRCASYAMRRRLRHSFLCLKGELYCASGAISQSHV